MTSDIYRCPLNKTTCKRSKPFPTLRALRYHIRHDHKGEDVPVFGVARTFIQHHNGGHIEHNTGEKTSSSNQNGCSFLSKNTNDEVPELTDNDSFVDYDFGSMDDSSDEILREGW